MWLLDYENHLQWIREAFSRGIPLLAAALSGLFLLLVLIWLRRLARRRNLTPSRDRAHSLEILEGRYAKGEISEEDFLKMKDSLGGSR